MVIQGTCPLCPANMPMASGTDKHLTDKVLEQVLTWDIVQTYLGIGTSGLTAGSLCCWLNTTTGTKLFPVTPLSKYIALL